MEEARGGKLEEECEGEGGFEFDKFVEMLEINELCRVLEILEM